jgi:hypothetical protein
MLKEMRETRKAQSLPKLKLSLTWRAPTFVIPRVINVGFGPALDPEIEMWVEPGDKTDKKIWQTQVMAPGEFQDFLYPKDAKGQVPSLDKLTENWQTLHFKGSYKDIYGISHEIEEKINLKEYVEIVKKSQARYQEDEWRQIRQELEKIRKNLEKLARKARS